MAADIFLLLKYVTLTLNELCQLTIKSYNSTEWCTSHDDAHNSSRALQFACFCVHAEEESGASAEGCESE